MAIKATLKKAKGAPTVTANPAQVGAVVDVEATVTGTDLEAAVAGEQESAPEQAEPTTTRAVAVRTPGAVSKYQEPEGSSFEGDWGAIPPKFPQLKLVQGSGKLSKEFNVGTIIYDGAELLPPVNIAKKETPHLIRFVPLRITLQFREKLSESAINDGEVPRIVNSVAEVEEAGGTTRWYGQTMPDNYWEPSARNLFLIEKPEGSDHPAFPLELGGKEYAVAVNYAAGGAFRNSSKLIYETGKTSLFVPVLDDAGKPVFNGPLPVKRALLYKCFWTICWESQQSKDGKYSFYRPKVRLLKEETGPEVREYCDNLLSNAAASRAAAAADSEADPA